MPDLEAIEVALTDLSDVSQGEPSTETEGLEQLEQPEDDAAEGPEVSAGEDSDKGGETRTQRRRRLRREREEQAQGEIRRLQAENERLKAREKSLARPDPNQYTSDAEYSADLAAYKVRKQDLEAEYSRIDADQGTVESDDAQAFQEAVNDFAAEGTEKYPDFADRVIKSDLPFSAIMVETLMDSDLGAETAYYLAQHPKEVTRISQLPPVSQARAIFEMEAKVRASQRPAKSNAPAPVKPLRGAAGAKQTKPLSEMSMAEYAKYRAEQMKAGG